MSRGLSERFHPEQADVARAVAQLPLSPTDVSQAPGDPGGVEITALHEGAVISERYVSRGEAALGARTWLLVGGGWAIFAVGVLLTTTRVFGSGTIMMFCGLGLSCWISGRIRGRQGARAYVLGESPEADLQVMGKALPGACLALVEATAAGPVLNFVRGMSGAVIIGGQRFDLEQLATAERMPGEGVHRYHIPREAQIRVMVGEHAFLISSGQPAPPAQAWARPEPREWAQPQA